MAGPKIKLDGADADIEINGVSLWRTMQEISNRLNIMHTNPELETQWAELRALGEQYRKLEQHILDKQATFDRVRAMPAPEVD
jgi:glutamate/tyrosine decarboxylase-like PLP-dependent enzyme